MPEVSEAGMAMTKALGKGDVEEFRRLARIHPGEISDVENREYWLFAAARKSRVDVMKEILDLGIDVNLQNSLKPHDTALPSAIHGEQLEMTTFLLSRGIDPNIGRPLITAINIKDQSRALEFVQLLVEHGADVNKLFEFMGDENELFTALDWASAKPTVAAYLKSRGAKTADELREM